MTAPATHSVFTDALSTLGTAIDTTAERDAIHLAVEPVEAGEKLYPGQHVNLVEGISKAGANPVGIVDPFLPGPIYAGQRFWLVVYPRQITSLRHVWEHPAFPPSGLDAAPTAEPSSSIADVSRQWIKDWALGIPLAYDVVMDGARDYLSHGDYLVFGGLLEGEYVPEEFWLHYERVTDTTVSEDKRGSFFSCAC